ncbi:hypothetical protein F2Q69_00036657 [Brassica cretica]|uniref:Uncharacterized protein n=1 Tax=Brassica cretica TaxID=69181 RepID=A0A8S9SKK4_BRACR|nr:hypothetical protein F2Q69_00036657 [Brassica cretica]
MGSVFSIQTPLTDEIFGSPFALWSAKTTETILLKTALSSSVEEDLRKERISWETEEPSGPEAAKVSAEFIDTEKTEFECLALVKKRFFETIGAMSFWLLMAFSTSMVHLDGKLEGFHYDIATIL